MVFNNNASLLVHWASLVAQTIKNLRVMWEIQVRSLGWEDPLKKGIASYPLQYPGLENSMDCGVSESDMTEQLSLHFSSS